MRKDVGHAPLMVISCGVIIENDKGEILLQKRRDNGTRALLGGAMDIGKKSNLPEDIHKYDKRVITDWTKEVRPVIID